MLRLSARFDKDVRQSKIAQAEKKVGEAVPKALTRAAQDGEKLLKTDYLQRGGTFTRTKANGWRWVKNPSPWLRVGTGTLRRSWLHVAAAKVSGGWQAMLVSRGVPYARIHEFGGTITIGARTFLRGVRGRNRGRISQGKTVGATKIKIRKRAYLAPMFKDQKAKWVSWVGQDLMAIFK